MTRKPRQAPAHVGPHLLLYDGPCGFCNAVVQRVLDRDRDGVFHFASLQSDAAGAVLARVGVRPDADSVLVVPRYRDDPRTVLARGSAALFVAGRLGWPWSLARLLRVLPGPWLDAAYDRVARNRHRLAPPHCVLPRPDQRDRFLDPADFRSEGDSS